MLFTLFEFEQFCKEKELKRGLQFFLKKKVIPVTSQRSSELVFLVNSKEISLKLRGDKLLSYTCNCASSNYCEHLCGVLFYLQPEVFDSKVIPNTVKTNTQKKVAEITKENIKIEKRKRIELDRIRIFIEAQTKQLHLKDIEPLLSENTVLTSCDVYELLFEHILKTNFNHEKLDSNEVNALTSKLNTFITKNTKEYPDEEVYLYFALYGLFLKLFLKRFSGDESKINLLYEKICNKLNLYFTNGLSLSQEAAWYQLSIQSIESNKVIDTGLFYFLLSRWISRTKNNSKLRFIQQTLSKRHVKAHHSQRIQKISLLKIMLNVRLHQLAKTAPKFLNETNGLEVMLAKCELYFCANKSNQAFKLLETSYEEIKKDYSEFYQEVLNYFIEQSIKWNRKDLEIKYLKEIFLHGLFILPERLKSYLNLFPKEKREEELNQLYGLVKKNPFNYSFDKVMVILWEAKRWDELIKEIKNQKSKFPLLHSVLIQKLPHYNSVDLDLYLKHLTSAILEKEFYPYQLKMVDMARDYLQNLPKNEMEPFMQNLLDGLLKQSQIYRYLKLEYNLD